MAKSKKFSAKDGKKPGFFTRLKNWFNDIRSELRRVNWPDKKKLQTNTATVLAIIVLMAMLVGVFDFVINFSLSRTGFYTVKPQPATSQTASQETAGSQPTDGATQTTVTPTTKP